jgi:putative SOS response-associated peptidase YedK
MCGRITLFSPTKAIAETFQIDPPTEITPRYNIAPSQHVAAVIQLPDRPKRTLNHFRWGLIPSWAKDPAIAYKLINTRSEIASERHLFRSAFKHSRCSVR